MKILKDKDIKLIMQKCKNIKNHYLCDDYEHEVKVIDFDKKADSNQKSAKVSC